MMALTPEALQRRRAQRRLELRRRRLRRLAAIAVALLALVIVSALREAGAGEEAGGGERDDGGGDEAAPAEPLPTLPTGRRRLFPDHRVVAFYGAPQADELGVLGVDSPAVAARKLTRQARPYATRRRPVLPAFELIATVADAAPGDGGLYRTRQSPSVIRRYLAAARRAKAILLLDVQPGRADFVTEAKALERWLREPDVGLALDPEWRMDPGEVPGETIGEVDAEEINAVSGWLSQLVLRHRLPDKLLLVHRFTAGMVTRPAAVSRPPGLAMTLNVDGFGTKAQKLAKYRELVPRRFHAGFKLFYSEDDGLMRPREVLRLRPQPDVVVYE